MIINAPWTPERVEYLNARQADPTRHPYTCPGPSPEYPDCVGLMGRTLTATVDGWVCQCGRYKQDWAHG